MNFSLLQTKPDSKVDGGNELEMQVPLLPESIVVQSVGSSGAENVNNTSFASHGKRIKVTNRMSYKILDNEDELVSPDSPSRYDRMSPDNEANLTPKKMPSSPEFSQGMGKSERMI